MNNKKIKTSVTISILFLSLLSISSFNFSQVNAQTTPLKVVTSIELLQDFIENIGGDLVEVVSIVKGNDDPHTYEPSPSEINALIQADILFLMGVQDLEPWWGGHEEGEEDEGEGHDEEGLEGQILADNPDLIIVPTINTTMLEIDDAIGGLINPHVWTSPVNAKMMCEIIYNNLSLQFSGDDLTTITNNYNTYITKLDVLIDEIESNRTLFEGTKIVMNHPSMKYLYDLLGINRTAVIEEQHGVEPSAQHIQGIKNLMNTEEITLIGHQSNLDVDQVNEIARETGSKIVFAAPLVGLPDMEGNVLDNYIDLIRYNIYALKSPQDPSEAPGIPGYPLFIIVMISIFGLIVVMRNKKVI